MSSKYRSRIKKKKVRKLGGGVAEAFAVREVSKTVIRKLGGGGLDMQKVDKVARVARKAERIVEEVAPRVKSIVK